MLLQQEAQLLQESFNRRFAAAQAAKADLIALLEEKAGRVAAIERELGLSSSATAAPGALVGCTLWLNDLSPLLCTVQTNSRQVLLSLTKLTWQRILQQRVRAVLLSWHMFFQRHQRHNLPSALKSDLSTHCLL